MKRKLKDGDAQNGLPHNKNVRLRLPLGIKIIYAVALACVPLYIAFLFSEKFSDFFNENISFFVRSFLANITNAIPFSIAELAILLIPIWVVIITRIISHRFGDSGWELFSGTVCVCSALAIVFTTFTLGFAPAYRGSTLDKKLRLERCNVSAIELYNTALELSTHVNRESGNVSYDADGFSIMPYSYAEMSDKLIDAYADTCERYTFIKHLDSNLKPVMLSEAMSYTHITGVYTFFTGEANINVAFPDYTIPFTGAHELSHQRGIARENEANFMAFLVCIRSDDAYIRYSAYLNMYEYVSSALYRADKELYFAAKSGLSPKVQGEMTAYSEFYDKYRDSTASNVSETVNDTFLKFHGTEGTASYGMVVDLAVAYFKSN